MKDSMLSWIVIPIVLCASSKIEPSAMQNLSIPGISSRPFSTTPQHRHSVAISLDTAHCKISEHALCGTCNCGNIIQLLDIVLCIHWTFTQGYSPNGHITTLCYGSSRFELCSTISNRNCTVEWAVCGFPWVAEG